MSLNVWESMQHVHHKRNTRLYVTDGEPLMAKYQVIVTQDEDGMYVAECPTIPGCVSEGKTLDGALANIKEAIQACLDTRRDLGLPPTVDVYEVEV